MLGIGGGGDVAGALAVAREIEALGPAVELGGVAWERFANDPYPGPRRLDELSGTRTVGTGGALVGPDAATPEGVVLCEAQMARHLGRKTALIDVTGGPAMVAEGIPAAVRELGCDLVVLCDVGGDVLAAGPEPGLASPLCDATVLAGACAVADVPIIGCVFGAGCDAELTAGEVMGRIALLAGAGGWLGTLSPAPATVAELVEACGLVPTEASRMAARCASGEIGPAEIRGGRRTVELGPLGALAMFFDPLIALREVAPLAAAVAGTGSLDAARDALAALGIRTELDIERDRYAAL